MKKLKIAVLYGGRSAEHEISLESAEHVLAAMDKEKYEIVPILINKDGKFTTPVPKDVDVVFPVLHGSYGEDGTVQGVIKMNDVAFVGAGVLGSAVGMDKDVAKRLLREAGISTAKFIAVKSSDEFDPDTVEKELNWPVFVKPANAGSSVGIKTAINKVELVAAMREAFKYDRKIIIEKYIDGREIECGVLGNDHPIASLPGEIIPSQDFYSYDAKYSEESESVLETPVALPEETTELIQELAIKTYQVLGCEGMGRVDMYMQDDGRLIIGEINTIPGFTEHSMFPKLWEMTGIPYPKLIDKVIELALERYEQERVLKTDRP